METNKNQTNLSKSRLHPTPRFYSPGGSSNLQLHVLSGGWTPKSLLPLGSHGAPSNTTCHWTPQVYWPNGI